jgi:hypothetical protein
MTMQIKASWSGDWWHCIVPCGSNCNPARVKEMRDWCRSNVGRQNNWVNWTVEDLHNHTNFVFYREQDAMMFALKWS